MMLMMLVVNSAAQHPVNAAVTSVSPSSLSLCALRVTSAPVRASALWRYAEQRRLTRADMTSMRISTETCRVGEGEKKNGSLPLPAAAEPPGG